MSSFYSNSATNITKTSLLFSNLLVTLLLTLCLIAPTTNALTCWSGSSRDTTLGERVCDESGDVQVCAMEAFKFPQNLYGAFCADEISCQRNKDAWTNDPEGSIYTEVVCCTVDYCNTMPGGPEENPTTPDDKDSSALNSKTDAIFMVLVTTVALSFLFP